MARLVDLRFDDANPMGYNHSALGNDGVMLGTQNFVDSSCTNQTLDNTAMDVSGSPTTTAMTIQALNSGDFKTRQFTFGGWIKFAVFNSLTQIPIISTGSLEYFGTSTSMKGWIFGAYKHYETSEIAFHIISDVDDEVRVQYEYLQWISNGTVDGANMPVDLHTAGVHFAMSYDRDEFHTHNSIDYYGVLRFYINGVLVNTIWGREHIFDTHENTREALSIGCYWKDADTLQSHRGHNINFLDSFFYDNTLLNEEEIKRAMYAQDDNVSMVPNKMSVTTLCRVTMELTYSVTYRLEKGNPLSPGEVEDNFVAAIDTVSRTVEIISNTIQGYDSGIVYLTNGTVVIAQDGTFTGTGKIWTIEPLKSMSFPVSVSV